MDLILKDWISPFFQLYAIFFFVDFFPGHKNILFESSLFFQSNIFLKIIVTEIVFVNSLFLVEINCK